LREKIPGKILGERYCQSCKCVEGQGWVDCTQKELQMLDLPPNPPPSSPSGPAAPIQDDGVLKQPNNTKRGSLIDTLNSPSETIYDLR
jgi:hypothetical protein